MARITVEDCLQHVDNRFSLVMVGSKRARQLSTYGKAPLVEEDSDKPTVIALREIAEGLITQQLLEQPDTDLSEHEELPPIEQLAELMPPGEG